MSKITISRLIEISNALKTDAGQQLGDFIQYMADLSEQTLRALRGGLTFQDNFKSQILEVELVHSTAQALTTQDGTIYGVIPLRVISTSTGIDAFSWYINDTGQLEVNVNFTGAPSGNIACNILVLYL